MEGSNKEFKIVLLILAWGSLFFFCVGLIAKEYIVTTDNKENTNVSSTEDYMPQGQDGGNNQDDGNGKPIVAAPSMAPVKTPTPTPTPKPTPTPTKEPTPTPVPRSEYIMGNGNGFHWGYVISSDSTGIYLDEVELVESGSARYEELKDELKYSPYDSNGYYIYNEDSYVDEIYFSSSVHFYMGTSLKNYSEVRRKDFFRNISSYTLVTVDVQGNEVIGITNWLQR